MQNPCQLIRFGIFFDIFKSPKFPNIQKVAIGQVDSPPPRYPHRKLNRQSRDRRWNLQEGYISGDQSPRFTASHGSYGVTSLARRSHAGTREDNSIAMALLRMPCVPAQSGWKKSSSLDNSISSVISSSSSVSFCKLGSGYVAQSDCGCVTKVRTSGIACRVRTEGSEDGAERDIGGMAASVSRRAVLWGLVAAQGLVMEREVARAGVPNYRKYVDRLDGYTFSYPAGWIEVRGAGADVFFRDPVNLDENLLVEISSPSSSKFKGVEDLGTPEQASKKVLQQYLTEFMSTRIGVRREANVTATKSRVGDDGRLYYEVEVR